jgi:hypothetical protein
MEHPTRGGDPDRGIGGYFRASNVWALLSGATVFYGAVLLQIALSCVFVFHGDLLDGVASADDLLRYYNWVPFLQAMSLFFFSLGTTMYRISALKFGSTMTTHATFNVMGLVSIICAAIIGMRYHNLVGAESYSVHGVLLTITALMALTQGLGGIFGFLWPGSRASHWSNALVPHHRTLGMMTYMLLFTTFLLNLQALQMARKITSAVPNWVAFVSLCSALHTFHWWSPASLTQRGEAAAQRGYEYESIPEHT